MSELEIQEEEREVLLSIYDGDTNFKQLTPTVFQYKVNVLKQIETTITLLFLSMERTIILSHFY